MTIEAIVKESRFASGEPCVALTFKGTPGSESRVFTGESCVIVVGADKNTAPEKVHDDVLQALRVMVAALEKGAGS